MISAKGNLLRFRAAITTSMLLCAILIASGSDLFGAPGQNGVVKTEVLYSEDGLKISYSLFDEGTRSLGAPGNQRDYPLYNLVVYIDNDTGKDVRFMGLGRVSFMYQARPGSAPFLVNFNARFWFEPGRTELHAGGPFAYNDERFEGEIPTPQYYIPRWITRESRTGGSGETPPVVSTNLLNNSLESGEVRQLQQEHRAEQARLRAAEQERQRVAAEQRRRADEDRRRAEQERQAMEPVDAMEEGPEVQYHMSCRNTTVMVVDGPCRRQQEQYAEVFGCNQVSRMQQAQYDFFDCLARNSTGVFRERYEQQRDAYNR